MSFIPTSSASAVPFKTSLEFRGHKVEVLQVRREGFEGEDVTGWRVWECTNVILKHVRTDEALRQLLQVPEGEELPDFGRVRMLDFSAGAGLMGIACAAAGAQVVLTDVPTQLPQMEHNIQANGVTDRCQVLPLFWGGDLQPLAEAVHKLDSKEGVPSRWKNRTEREGYVGECGTGPSPVPLFDVILVSDILYIALRDKLDHLLARTLRQLSQHCRSMVFAFEERLWREEGEWMEALAAPAEGSVLLKEKEASEQGSAGGAASPAAADASAPPSPSSLPSWAQPLRCHEYGSKETKIAYEERLPNAGGESTELGELFWEPPSIRMFKLQQQEKEKEKEQLQRGGSAAAAGAGAGEH